MNVEYGEALDGFGARHDSGLGSFGDHRGDDHDTERWYLLKKLCED